MNCLRALLNHLADAASYWLQTPFDAADELWNNPRPRDGADRLAEREAEIDVAEPKACECGGIWAIWHDFDCERALREAHSTSAAPDIRSSVDAADGPRGTAAQPETRAGHPNLTHMDLYNASRACHVQTYDPHPLRCEGGLSWSELERKLSVAFDIAFAEAKAKK